MRWIALILLLSCGMGEPCPLCPGADGGEGLTVIVYSDDFKALEGDRSRDSGPSICCR